MIYRCGYCGTPTNNYGEPLNLEQCKIITDEELNNAELVHGYCCLRDEEDNHGIVTRDMAIDAQDMSLEGQSY